MQGTIAVLMALSGLGCHHKSCDVAVPSCYSSCYSAPVVDMGCGGCGAYTAPVYPAPAIIDYGWSQVSYAGCGSPCGGSPCGGRRHGLFSCLFGGHRRAGCCSPTPICYNNYAMPMVYGDYTAASVVPSAQYAAPQTLAPVGTVEPAPAATTTPAPTPAAPVPAPEPGATPPPPPAPAPDVPAPPAAAAPVPGVPAPPAIPGVPTIPAPPAPAGVTAPKI
jgi:hypothetical protein